MFLIRWRHYTRLHFLSGGATIHDYASYQVAPLYTDGGHTAQRFTIWIKRDPGLGQVSLKSLQAHAAFHEGSIFLGIIKDNIG